MRVLFNDCVLRNGRRSYRVIRVDDTMYVVAPGFVCQVDTCEEGFQLVAKLKAQVAVNENPKGPGI